MKDQKQESGRVETGAMPLYPVPDYLKALGIMQMEKDTKSLPPVFAVENPFVERTADFVPEEGPMVFQDTAFLRNICKVRLCLSYDSVDLLCALYDGKPIYEGECPEGKVIPCTLAEIKGTEEKLDKWDWQALMSGALRTTMAQALLLDSVDMERPVYKAALYGQILYFVLVPDEGRFHKKPEREVS